MQEDIIDEELAYQADRMLIMELIKDLADELLKYSSEEPDLLPKVCRQIKELSDDMISILYEDAAREGVGAEGLKTEVAFQFISFLSVNPRPALPIIPGATASDKSEAVTN